MTFPFVPFSGVLYFSVLGLGFGVSCFVFCFVWGFWEVFSQVLFLVFFVGWRRSCLVGLGFYLSWTSLLSYCTQACFRSREGSRAALELLHHLFLRSLFKIPDQKLINMSSGHRWGYWGLPCYVSITLHIESHFTIFVSELFLSRSRNSPVHTA